MPPIKTPTSSLSAIELLWKRVSCRASIRIQRLRSGNVSPPAPASSSSPAPRLPPEIVEMVVAHITYDMPTLIACSETCYSWYLASVPYLHPTLYVNIDSWDPQHQWPNPILSMHALGLFPFVENVQIRSGLLGNEFYQGLLSKRVLRHFSQLRNVRHLEIDKLDTASFIHKLRQYFGHFLPTVQSLSLKAPKGSRWQIIFFIGLFEHLQDLSLHDSKAGYGVTESELGQGLVPPFFPPLQGRLTVWRFRRGNLFKDMVQVFGEIRFREMDLFDTDGTPVLLNACTNTLRSLRLYPTDPYKVTNFDLGRNKSLRTLEITAGSIDDALKADTLPNVSKMLDRPLQTIRSSIFSVVKVIYQEFDFQGIQTAHRSNWPHLHRLSRDEKTEENSRHQQRFELLREICKKRELQLELHADVWAPVGDYSVRRLNDAVAAEKKRNGFGEFASEPSVTYQPHRGLRSVVVPRS